MLYNTHTHNTNIQDEVPVSLADERTFHDDIARERDNLYVPEPMLSKVRSNSAMSTCICSCASCMRPSWIRRAFECMSILI
jgi:hypothetical protein